MAAPAPDPGFRRAISTIRGGLALGAVAAALLALAPSFDLVTGPPPTRGAATTRPGWAAP